MVTDDGTIFCPNCIITELVFREKPNIFNWEVEARNYMVCPLCGWNLHDNRWNEIAQRHDPPFTGTIWPGGD